MLLKESLNVMNTTERNVYDYALTLKTSPPPELINFCKEKSTKDKKAITEAGFTGKSFIDDRMYLPETLVSKCNKWLKNLQLPALDYAVLFQRRNYFQLKNSSIHIDYNHEYNDLSKCALNIPIKNCENTSMAWWTGDFTSTLTYSNGMCGKSSVYDKEYTIPSMLIEWNQEPVFITSYNIPNTPHLCKVDVPHSVTAHSNFRVMLSLRLDGNPSFEEVKKMLNKDTVL